MGRSTEALARTGAEVFAFDSSVAVESNVRNMGRSATSISHRPTSMRPSTKGGPSIVSSVSASSSTARRRAERSRRLSILSRSGGEIVIDVYWLSWRCLLLGKYYLRPLTRRLRPETLHRLVKTLVGGVHSLTGSI